jgi:hypothetical protein
MTLSMVSSSIEFAVVILIPVVVLVLLRVNAAMVFLSLCLGYVLVQFVANDANSLVNFVAPNVGSLSASTLRLVLLFAPPVLTAVMMLFSVRGRLRPLINILPAAGTALLAILLAVPLLTPGLRHAIEQQYTWQQISKMQSFIVGASALISLLALWAQRSHSQHLEHRRNH